MPFHEPTWNAPVPEGTAVEVLYENDDSYQRVSAGEVEWGRRLNPVVLWRIAAPDC